MKRMTPLICMSVLGLAFTGPVTASETGMKNDDMGMTEQKEELKGAKETAGEAAQVLKQLRTEQEGGTRLLEQAKAVFIVPDYGRASLGVGGAGGEGVLVVNNNGDWTGPAFYNIGSVNIGLEAGAEAGAVAFLVMSDQAMAGFSEDNNFSLNADAGLTLIDWSNRGQISAGKGADVVVWADTEGLYGNISASITDIFWDGEANQAYYQKHVAANEILNGSVQDPVASSPLQSEFSALETSEMPDKDKGMSQEDDMGGHTYKKEDMQDSEMK